jgi:tRNA pseudouridine55 synthase
MTGILLIDKPSGPTSHDVVARVRRVSGERSIGHTGTLDPRATGLLPLVLGRATRLASYVTSGDKTYEAVIRLGFATDTDDADGEPMGPAQPTAAATKPAAVEAALVAFRGTFDQLPPNHSAKKVAGQRAYELARQSKPVVLTPVSVTVRELVRITAPGAEDAPETIRVRVRATAGFYVRALARDLGERLGCGAHLADLRRTRCEPFDVSQAVRLDEAERLGPALEARLLTPAEALPHLPAVRVTEPGLVRVRHGNAIGPDQVAGALPPASAPGPVRLLTGDGHLVALAHSRGGALHPIVVLG